MHVQLELLKENWKNVFKKKTSLQGHEEITGACKQLDISFRVSTGTINQLATVQTNQCD